MSSRPNWLVVADAAEWRALRDVHPRETLRVIARSHALREELRAAGEEVELWEDFLPWHRRDAVQHDMDTLGVEWPVRMERPAFRDALRFEGIDFAELLRFGFHFLFVEVVRNVAIAKALFAAPTPERVAFADNGSTASSILAGFCRMHGVSFEARAIGAAQSIAPGAVRARRGRNPLAALRRLLQVLAGARRVRGAHHECRALIGEGPYTRAFVDRNRGPLAYAYFPRPGSAVSWLFRFASAAPGFRRTRRALRQRVTEIRRIYAEMVPPSLTCDGVDIWPYVKPGFDAVFSGMFSGMFADGQAAPRLETPFGGDKLRALEDVADEVCYAILHLDAAQPNVVLAGQDAYGIERALVACARARGVPTAVLLHGVPAAYFPLYADVFFVWGKGQARLLSDVYGESPQRLVVTGKPTPSARAPADRAGSIALGARIGIPADARVILYVGRPANGIHLGEAQVYWERQVDAVLAETGRIAGTWLVLRPHPTEDYRVYEAAAARAGHRSWCMDRKNPLAEILALSDVVLLRDSTSCLDAIGMGKRIVVVNLFPHPVHLPFAELDGIPVVTRARDLAPAITKALESPAPAAPATGTAPDSRFFKSQVECETDEAAAAIHAALVGLAISRAK